MYKATTPTAVFTFPESIDMTQASAVYVTFADMRSQTILTKETEELTISEHEVRAELTQEETLQFQTKQFQVQINWLYEENGKIKRACSKIVTGEMGDNLIPEVLEGESE